MVLVIIIKIDESLNQILISQQKESRANPYETIDNTIELSLPKLVKKAEERLKKENQPLSP